MLLAFPDLDELDSPDLDELDSPDLEGGLELFDSVADLKDLFLMTSSEMTTKIARN